MVDIRLASSVSCHTPCDLGLKRVSSSDAPPIRLWIDICSSDWDSLFDIGRELQNHNCLDLQVKKDSTKPRSSESDRLTARER